MNTDIAVGLRSASLYESGGTSPHSDAVRANNELPTRQSRSSSAVSGARPTTNHEALITDHSISAWVEGVEWGGASA